MKRDRITVIELPFVSFRTPTTGNEPMTTTEQELRQAIADLVAAIQWIRDARNNNNELSEAVCNAIDVADTIADRDQRYERADTGRDSLDEKRDHIHPLDRLVDEYRND